MHHVSCRASKPVLVRRSSVIVYRSQGKMEPVTKGVFWPPFSGRFRFEIHNLSSWYFYISLSASLSWALGCVLRSGRRSCDRLCHLAVVQERPTRPESTQDTSSVLSLQRNVLLPPSSAFAHYLCCAFSGRRHLCCIMY